MSSEMMEGVARAMFDVDLGASGASMQWARKDLDERGYYKKARAAVEAMMEPTEGMLFAVWQFQQNEMNLEKVDMVTPYFTKQLYTAMIQAALKGGGDG